jgi:hypothetical protein
MLCQSQPVQAAISIWSQGWDRSHKPLNGAASLAPPTAPQRPQQSNTDLNGGEKQIWILEELQDSVCSPVAIVDPLLQRALRDEATDISDKRKLHSPDDRQDNDYFCGYVHRKDIFFICIGTPR